jgi:hypothetical protein
MATHKEKPSIVTSHHETRYREGGREQRLSWIYFFYEIVQSRHGLAERSTRTNPQEGKKTRRCSFERRSVHQKSDEAIAETTASATPPLTPARSLTPLPAALSLAGLPPADGVTAGENRTVTAVAS